MNWLMRTPSSLLRSRGQLHPPVVLQAATVGQLVWWMFVSAPVYDKRVLAVLDNIVQMILTLSSQVQAPFGNAHWKPG